MTTPHSFTKKCRLVQEVAISGCGIALTLSLGLVAEWMAFIFLGCTRSPLTRAQKQPRPGRSATK